MALVEGTNCGFVLSAPSSDPGDLDQAVDNAVFGGKFTSPADAATITEIGWWCDNATEESNFEVGIYTDSSNYPNAVVGSLSQTNAKGTGAGWKVVSGLSISISPSTTYWICGQLDNTATTTNWNYSTSTGTRITKASQTALTDPFVSAGTVSSSRLVSIYAVYTTSGGGGNVKQINIGDAWKTISGMQINIGDAWKPVTSMKINIGDTWKTCF